jgi:hypothetical protein
LGRRKRRKGRRRRRSLVHHQGEAHPPVDAALSSIGLRSFLTVRLEPLKLSQPLPRLGLLIDNPSSGPSLGWSRHARAANSRAPCLRRNGVRAHAEAAPTRHKDGFRRSVAGSSSGTRRDQGHPAWWSHCGGWNQGQRRGIRW